MHYQTRQTSYLRISAHEVLQMELYLEEYNVAWMNDDYLERMLVALKDKIPIKVRAETANKSEKQDPNPKPKIDVFRGFGYQIAYYFRRMAQQHAVLLKDKRLYYPEATRSPPAKRAKTNVSEPTTSTSKSTGTMDLTSHDDDLADLDEGGAGNNERAPVVKDEDDDVVIIPEEGDEGPGEGADYEEEPKPDLDAKPLLKVDYKGYSIHKHSLVVIIEPYPPLSDEQRKLNRMTEQPTEIRQLSASVAPESFRMPSSVPPARGARKRGSGQPALFFRSDTTPMMDEVEKEMTTSALRRSRTVEVTDSEEELPTMDEILESRRRKQAKK
ncbi:hypothetical protein T439DRAFT_323839 [Meredithblackwellia eburnea MCA 4105]